MLQLFIYKKKKKMYSSGVYKNMFSLKFLQKARKKEMLILISVQLC